MDAQYVTSPVLDETGYVVLDPYSQQCDPIEWVDLDYVGWRSSGVTRFAPLTSYAGEIECNAFWNHTPPRADRDGVWIPEQVAHAPRLRARAEEPGANIGRCRVIELQPNTYADAIYNLHRDDNNRLNPPGSGWIVRGFFNLTDDPHSLLLLRQDRDDPTTEVRIPLSVGTRVIVDTERLHHSVWHRGDSPRYSLITSWESGPALDAYIATHSPETRVEPYPLSDKLVADAQAEALRRRAERADSLAAVEDAFDQLDEDGAA